MDRCEMRRRQDEWPRMGRRREEMRDVMIAAVACVLGLVIALGLGKIPQTGSMPMAQCDARVVAEKKVAKSGLMTASECGERVQQAVAGAEMPPQCVTACPACNCVAPVCECGDCVLTLPDEMPEAWEKQVVAALPACPDCAGKCVRAESEGFDADGVESWYVREVVIPEPEGDAEVLPVPMMEADVPDDDGATDDDGDGTDADDDGDTDVDDDGTDEADTDTDDDGATDTDTDDDGATDGDADTDGATDGDADTDEEVLLDPPPEGEVAE